MGPSSRIHWLSFVHVIIQKKLLASDRVKINYTTCNQLAVLTVLANNQPFRRKDFMTQCTIDDIFVEIKMMPCSVKFRNLKHPDALKLCLKKREKPTLFSK